MKRGGIGQHVAAKKAREAERAGRAQSRAGILEILREIAQDEGEVGAYRVAASKLLLTPEGDVTCNRACCKADLPRVPKDVREWLDIQHESHLRGLAATYQDEGRCPSCRAARHRTR